jgi:chromate reductase
MYPLNQPEVMVPFAKDKIDENGRVVDPKTREKIREMLEALVVWARKFKKG